MEAGKYIHFLGNIYEVLFIALDCETKEEIVVYKSLKDNKRWVRSLIDFNEFIQVPGEGYIPRFKRLK